ncbi:DUF6920 family protein [Roseateles sp.]|uniref:DUF6920 family protein n=1 Tax=Roseateles sp. TaxID=1971397 RepID=UPI003BA9150A
MPWLPWFVSTACALVLALVGITAFGQRRWAARVLALQRTLEAGRVDAGPAATALPTRYDARELDGLPAPVQRYFRTVLKDGQPIITAAWIDTEGRFSLSPTAAQWKPFAARQRVITRRPGFLWDARISMLPGVTVRVVDSYIAGRGLLRAAVQGLFSMAALQGDGEVARGEFMRWFAEAAWYPTALLPSQGTQWQAVDDRSARATAADGPIRLTLLFSFNDAGLISAFRAEARGAMVGRQMVMAPWEGSWSNYQAHDGVMVPCTGEVAWMRDGARRPYFVGAVTALKFECSP